MRKIIQISTAAGRTDTAVEQITHALCDDGTVWAIDTATKVWDQLPPIPQPDEYDPIV